MTHIRHDPEPPSWQPAMPYLKVAAAEARALGHGHVGPEHLLLALADRPTGAGQEFFRRHGITGDSLRAALVAVMGAADEPVPMDVHLTTTIRCDLAIEIARRYVPALSPSAIEPDVLLSAILHPDVAEGATVAAVLEKLGLTASDARAGIGRSTHG